MAECACWFQAPNWPGYKDRSLPDRRGNAWHPLPGCGDRAGGYQRSSEQRSNSRFAYGHGGGETGAVGGAGNQADFDWQLDCWASRTLSEEFRAACRKQVAAHGAFHSWARYEAPSDVFWDDEKYRGEAYAAFAWAVYVAEVTVDLTTYSASVDDFVALQEVGGYCTRYWRVGKSPAASRRGSDTRCTRK